VERCLDHDLSRFEIVHLSTVAALGSGGSEDNDEDEETHAVRLEEENLPIISRNFI